MDDTANQQTQEHEAQYHTAEDGSVIDNETGEVVTEAHEAAPESRAIVAFGGKVGTGLTLGGKAFKVKGVVNKPVLSLAKFDEITIAVTIKTAIYEGKEVKVSRKEGGGTFTSKAHMVDVLNLDVPEGKEPELCSLVLGKVLEGVLQENFPDDSYIGKSFAIRKRKQEGKQYFAYDVVEIEPEE